MSVKGSHTTATYIEWNLIHQIIADLVGKRKHHRALLITVGIYTGLRISDFLAIRWIDLLDKDVYVTNEKKTGKRREIQIHPILKKMVLDTYIIKEPASGDYLMFGSPTYPYKPLPLAVINKWLVSACKGYPVKGRPSSHTLRKTFGRRIWENNNKSDSALVMLGELFNHRDPITTRRYLGIRQEELGNLYKSL